MIGHFGPPTYSIFASLEKGRTGQIDGTGPVEALLNIENLIGSDRADVLEDDADANDIHALDGDDTILGHGGADTLNGGAGTDTYRAVDGNFAELRLPLSASIELLDLVNGDLDGTAGEDVFDLSGITGYVTADTIDLGDGDDTFIGTQAADMVRGNSNNDRLEGRGGNDTLEGGAGTDTLIGGTGDDVMTGGNVASVGNTFVIAPGDGEDIITDFQLGRDILDLMAFSDAQLDDMTVALNGDGDRLITFHDGGTLTLEGVARNHTPFGSVRVIGDAVEDSTLSVDFSQLTDYDTFDAADVSYQWLRDGEAISGATAATYEADQADVNARVSVEIRYTDLFKTDELRVSSQSQVIRNVNDAPTGAVEITGEVTQNGILTAASALVDVDGLGALSYQWLRDGAPVDGATGSTYVLGQVDVGASMSTRVSYTDAQGTAEAVTSAATGAVTNVNDAPTGGVTVSGSTTPGATLTAISTLADADGLGTLTYQWLRDGAAVSGQTGASYVTGAADANAQISVTVSYTDGGGTPETVTSAAATIDAGTPFVNGTDIAENVNGTDASEQINAGAGGDWITPGAGSDSIDGGTGNDMVSFVTLADTPGRTNVQYRLDLDLTTGTATTSGDDVYTISNVERVTGTIFADRIKGDAGDNELRGLGDYDWFTATTGRDTVDGGTGQDMISYVDWLSTAVNTADPFNPGGAPPPNGEVTGVVVDLNDTSNNTNLAAGHTYISVERVTGSGRQDVFYGDENENDFRGLGDFDWFVGSTGGRERYFGGDGSDTVTYYNSTSGVNASLSNGARVNGEETGRGTAGDAALDLYFSIESLVGTNYNDRLEGGAGGNNLNGLAGDDFIFGYGGIDYMKGGTGNDVINGGAGSDYAIFDGNRADYTIFRTASNEVRTSGADGFDVHTDVEYFRFDDADVTIWELTVL